MQRKKNKKIEGAMLYLTKYVGADSDLSKQEIIQIMIVLMESLFFNMTSSDVLMISFMSVKDAIEKMDIDTEKGIKFLTNLYFAADKRRQQNFLSRF